MIYAWRSSCFNLNTRCYMENKGMAHVRGMLWGPLIEFPCSWWWHLPRSKSRGKQNACNLSLLLCVQISAMQVKETPQRTLLGLVSLTPLGTKAFANIELPCCAAPNSSMSNSYTFCIAQLTVHHIPTTQQQGEESAAQRYYLVPNRVFCVGRTLVHLNTAIDCNTAILWDPMCTSIGSHLMPFQSRRPWGILNNNMPILYTNTIQDLKHAAKAPTSQYWIRVCSRKLTVITLGYNSPWFKVIHKQSFYIV